MLEDYTALLDSSDDDARWDAEGLRISRMLVRRFDGNDWTGLGRRVTTRPARWLTRCAATLDSSSPGDPDARRALEVLMQLLAHDDAEVRVAAMRSVQALAHQGVAMDDRLDELAAVLSGCETTGHPELVILEELLGDPDR